MYSCIGKIQDCFDEKKEQNSLEIEMFVTM